MKCFILIALLLCSTVVFAEPLVLSKNGTTSYSIVLPEKPTGLEKDAAAELAKYLKKITKAAFEITDKPGGENIYIGSSFARDADSLGRDGLMIKTVGRDLYISGGTRSGRGTLFGIYEFLEQLGCRFWTADAEKIVTKNTLVVPSMDIRQIPAFPEMRWIISYGKTQYIGSFRSNGTCTGWGSGKGRKLPEKYGDVVDLLPFNCHTYSYFIPAAKYGKTNPEYFAFYKGKRVVADKISQLCLTNEKMTAEFIKNCREYLKNNYKPGMMLTVSQNDNQVYCRCDNCTRVDAEEGSPSGTNIRFVNKIAAALKAEYPTLKIRTNAYQYTRKPPAKTKADPNVVIGLCNLECDFAKGMSGTPENEKFFDNLKKWTRISSLICVVDYGTTFDHYPLPLPNFDALAERLRLAKENGVKGFCTINVRATGGGEFNDLRNYLTARLAWNPELDPWSIAKEFCDGFYGPAGKPLYEYLKFYHDLAKEKKLNFYYAKNPLSFYDEAYRKTANDYFQQAFRAVEGNAVLTGRVENAYLSIRYMELITQSASINASPELLKKLNEFKALCRKFKVTKHCESGSMQEFLDMLGINVPTPEFCRDIPRSDWFVVKPLAYDKTPHGWIVNRAEDDSLSCIGKAIHMTTNHKSWAIEQYTKTLPGIDSSDRYDAYVSLRVVPGKKADNNTVALSAGFCEPGRGTLRKKIMLKDTSDKEYRYFKIAEKIPATLNGRVWLAPMNNPAEVKGIYVDHVIFVLKK